MSTDTIRAAGLGLAAAVDSLLALAFTVVLARLLGADEYGSLAALVSAFVILSIAGSGLQVTVAREVSWRSGERTPASGLGVRRWTVALALLAVCLLALSVPLRHPIAAVIGVDQEWAAAVLLPMAGLWLLISFHRGVLLGAQAYRAVGLSVVGEPAGWLTFGVGFTLAGLGVTGALLGMALAELALVLLLLGVVRRRLAWNPEESVRELGYREVLAAAAVPMAGLMLVAGLQNVDVIAVNHLASSDAAASSYAAASVAAKVIVWLAIGVSLYMLPEAARRAGEGLDGRPILGRALGVVVVAAVPMILIYALAGHDLLEVVFGVGLASASEALPLLGVAMTLLAITYLTVQYLLALGRTMFLTILAVAAVAEPLLLWLVGGEFTQIAVTLIGLQLALALTLLALSISSRRPIPRAKSRPEARPFRADTSG